MGLSSGYSRSLMLTVVLGGYAAVSAGCSQEGLLGSQYVTPGPSVSSDPQVTVVAPSLVGSTSSGHRTVDDIERELVAVMQGSACIEPKRSAVQFHGVWSRWFSSRGATSASAWSTDDTFERVVVGQVATFRDLCPAHSVAKFRMKLTKLEPSVATDAGVKRVWAPRRGSTP